MLSHLLTSGGTDVGCLGMDDRGWVSMAWASLADDFHDRLTMLLRFEVLWTWEN